MRRKGRIARLWSALRWPLVLIGAGIIASSTVGYLAMVGYHWQRLAGADCRLVVLMFHAIVPDGTSEARYRMQESEFARQIDELRAAGASTRHISQIIPALSAERSTGACPFRDREVVLTFDLDGPADHGELTVPVLARNDLLGLFFVPTGHIGWEGAVARENIRALAEAGMMIGSHTHTHPDMRQLEDSALMEELDLSRAVLESLTSEPLWTVAAPGGRYNEWVMQAVRTAGYAALFTSDPCYVLPSASRYRLCRIEIRGDRGMTALDAVTNPRMVAVQATNWWIKRRLEAVLGPTMFGRLSRLRRSLHGPGN